MLYRCLFGFIFLCLAYPVEASETVNRDVIADSVKVFLQGQYSDALGAQEVQTNVNFQPANLDARLQLAGCATPLGHELASPNLMAQNVTVKVSCSGPKPWTIYVPVKVTRMTEVIVSARNLSRGTLIDNDDLAVARVDVAHAGMGYFTDVKSVVGMELQQNIHSGMVIPARALKPERVIKRGDTVSVVAAKAGIAVATNAEALSNGRLGERIRVKNLRSKRIIEALVTGRGMVATGY